LKYLKIYEVFDLEDFDNFDEEEFTFDNIEYILDNNPGLLLGRKVKLKKDSEFYFQSDGDYGTIIDFINVNGYPKSGSKEFKFRIKWNNGHIDSYRLVDLEF